MGEDTLLKYIKDELTGEEKQVVVSWINKSEKNRQRYAVLKAEYTASGFNSQALDVEKAYRKVRKSGKRKQRNRKIRSGIAVVAIGLLGYFFFFTKETNISNTIVPESMAMVTAVTPKGASKDIVLPDGTHVVLNADSELNYSKTFNGDVREVYLYGEAYFEVVRDTTRPFIVHADDMSIKVLGTSFNVRSYSEDSEIQTTLVHGSVEIQGTYISPVKLEPLQTASLGKSDKQLEIKNVSREEAAPWKEGKLIFRETPLENVLEDLERKYDVLFEVRSDGLYEYLYTGTFDNLSIDEVLKVLKISSPITYRKEGQKIILD